MKHICLITHRVAPFLIEDGATAVFGTGWLSDQMENRKYFQRTDDNNPIGKSPIWFIGPTDL